MASFFSRLAYATLAVGALGAGVALAVSTQGCSSDDTAAPSNDASASTGSPDAGLCDPTGARNGGPCYPVTPVPCFQVCNNVGGCVCKQDPNNADAGIWSCTPVDTSCLPDSAPIDEFDSGPLPDGDVTDDSGSTDDAGDAGADADAG